MRAAPWVSALSCSALLVGGATFAQEPPRCTNAEMRVALSGDEMASFSKLSCGLIQIDLRGSARLEVGLVLADSVAVTGTQQSSLQVQRVTTGDLRMALTDSAQARVLDGHASRLTLRNAGAGVADLEGMGSRSATVELPAAGSAHVDAQRDLAGDVSGAGELHSKGTPVLAKVNVSGAGRYWTGPRN